MKAASKSPPGGRGQGAGGVSSLIKSLQQNLANDEEKKVPPLKSAPGNSKYGAVPKTQPSSPKKSFSDKRVEVQPLSRNKTLSDTRLDVSSSAKCAVKTSPNGSLSGKRTDLKVQSSPTNWSSSSKKTDSRAQASPPSSKLTDSRAQPSPPSSKLTDSRAQPSPPSSKLTDSRAQHTSSSKLTASKAQPSPPSSKLTNSRAQHTSSIKLTASRAQHTSSSKLTEPSTQPSTSSSKLTDSRTQHTPSSKLADLRAQRSPLSSKPTASKAQPSPTSSNHTDSTPASEHLESTSLGASPSGKWTPHQPQRSPPNESTPRKLSTLPSPTKSSVSDKCTTPSPLEKFSTRKWEAPKISPSPPNGSSPPGKRTAQPSPPNSSPSARKVTEPQSQSSTANGSQSVKHNDTQNQSSPPTVPWAETDTAKADPAVKAAIDSCSKSQAKPEEEAKVQPQSRYEKRVKAKNGSDPQKRLSMNTAPPEPPSTTAETNTSMESSCLPVDQKVPSFSRSDSFKTRASIFPPNSVGVEETTLKPFKSTTNAPPLPSKSNRPRLQHQPETTSFDDSVEEPVAAFKSNLRPSKSLDDVLDRSLDPTCAQLQHQRDPNMFNVELRKSASDAKEKTKSSFKSSNPIAFLRKHTDSNGEKRRSTGEGIPRRRSFGENLKTNFENMFKGRNSGEIYASAKEKLKEMCSRSSSASRKPTSPGRPRLRDVVQDSQTSDSADDDDEADTDEEFDWDEGEFSDADFEDSEDDKTSSEAVSFVTEKQKRGTVYENVNVRVGKPPADIQQKKRQIVEEIVSSETNYVNKLYLLNKTSWQLSGACLEREMMPQSVVHKMFPCIEALYRLHGENILPALKAKLENWSEASELSSLWKKYLPFLTMYKSYTSQYDWSLDTISQYRKTSSEFTSCMAKIEERTEFGKMSIEHHLLEPIQRLARYRLLMENFCKLLPETDPEKSKATEIVEAFDKLLQACQSQLRKRDLFGDLCKLQERFEDSLSLLSPTAQQLSEGKVVEIKGSNNRRKVKRQLFLFTDSVLICSKRQSSKHRIIHQMELEDIKIRPADPSVASSFGSDKTMTLTEKERSVTLYFKSTEKKDEWEDRILEALQVKIEERKLRNDGRNSTKLKK